MASKTEEKKKKEIAIVRVQLNGKALLHDCGE